MDRVANVTTRRNRMVTAGGVILKRNNYKVEAVTALELTDIVIKLLPKGCKYDVIYKSIISFVGHNMTIDQLKQWCWTLAGNVKLLRQGKSPYPAKIPSDPVSVVIQFTASKKLTSQTGEVGVKYRAKILVGPGCSTDIEFKWSERLVRYFASHPKGLGFSPPSKKGRVYQHSSTLVGMRCVVDLFNGSDGKLHVTKPRCTGSLRKYNQNLTEMRWRSNFNCPFNYSHPCHNCYRGQESCPASCKPKDLESKYCYLCKQNSMFDPAWLTLVCMKCSSKPKHKPPT